MSEFVVRDISEQPVAKFQDFSDAWDYLVFDLENQGDIVEMNKEKRVE